MDSRWFRRFGQPGDPGPAGRSGASLAGGPEADAVRLICFPHAGGSAGAYLPLTRVLAPRLDVVAVQYPGRQDRRREPGVADITELARLVAERLTATSSDSRPYAFFGHSMGALLAYETARALRDRQAPAPVRLFLSARGAPSTAPNPHDSLPDDTAILAAVRALGGTGAAVLDDPELVAMALPALRADYRALASYTWRPGDPLDTPFSVLCGLDDPVVGTAEAARWGEHTRAGSDLTLLPGGHFYLDQRLGDVAELILRGVRTAVTR
ncbi:thioesterase II family protein [Streptomyces sp. NPDC047928]|uniref:thioesterase II family protein n=1 Tax=unclassified Streptomyces TaxID=2593676 RepID=UPI00371AB246